MEEDLEHEFKAAHSLAFDGPMRLHGETGEITKNVIAFLNSETGGTLYLGITDAGKIQGCPRFDRGNKDKFRTLLSQMRKSIQPAVPTELVTSNFVPIRTASGCKMADGSCYLKDTFVVEVVVKPGLSKAQPTPFESRVCQAFAKEAGGVSLMSGATRQFLIKKYEALEI